MPLRASDGGGGAGRRCTKNPEAVSAGWEDDDDEEDEDEEEAPAGVVGGFLVEVPTSPNLDMMLPPPGSCRSENDASSRRDRRLTVSGSLAG